ncbi:tyrosine-type recombinase/integrase [Lysinibacillus capsici]|uniref:tyrosine-type recombinase/integrase n=1 Tax=Lysinibacillus capsici TaxID=2115968 RepID=UPI0036BEBBD8
MKNNLQLNKAVPSFDDFTFRAIIEEFSLKNKSIAKNEIELFSNFFYRECQKEKDLFEPKKTSIQLKNLKMNHVLKIQEHVENLLNVGELDKSEVILILNLLSKFCRFLTNKEITKIYYRPPSSSKNIIRNSKSKLPIISKFTSYLEIRNYAPATIQNYITSINYFLNYSNYKPDIECTEKYWKICTQQFENHLSKEVLYENIALCTAYGYLKAVRLFLRFLYEKNHIRFIYKIPEKMIQNGKRCNEYVNLQDLLLVLEKIFECSNHILRDISIFLILTETGCRPIEIVNLNVDDIYFHEKLIVLKCKKSLQRTLCLTETTIKFIKEYLQIRKNYLPLFSTEALFLSDSGTQIRSHFITYLFRHYNLKTFKEIRFTPKSLRHTFITNSLNNNNNIEQVKDTVGHKHLVSTYYYFYRDINSLKKLFFEKKLL